MKIASEDNACSQRASFGGFICCFNDISKSYVDRVSTKEFTYLMTFIFQLEESEEKSWKDNWRSLARIPCDDNTG